MTTSIDIRALVAAACSLLFFAAILAAFLRASWTDRFREAASFYTFSLLALATSAAGVFISQSAPVVISALMIISGAHFSILLAYLSVNEAIRPALHVRLKIIAGAAVCLGQVGMIALLQDPKLLIITSSVVNGIVGIAAGYSLWSLMTTVSRRHRLLVSAPFCVLGGAYILRLGLLGLAEAVDWFALASTVMSFLLASAALFVGFTLIIIRENALGNELRRAREQSEENLRQRTQLFTQMNHELRTPLNGIVGLTRILSGYVKEEKGKRALRDLQFSAALLKTVVDDVLDFAKLDRGSIELESLQIDLSELLEEIVAQYRGLAAEKGVAVRFTLCAGRTTWRQGDPMRLRQLLHNVIGNAVKFTARGEIDITADLRSESGITINVADTGIGMTEDQLAHIFEPFRQASASTTRQFGGTGLGMTIVKMLVDAMGGAVAAQSVFGTGTRIELVLPLPQISAPVQQPIGMSGKVIDTGDLGGLRVLSADDDEINGLVMEAFLTELGVMGVMAKSGRQAIELASDSRFDVYLIDINMPGMDGVETLAELRRIDQRRGGTAPLAVAVTANVMAEDIRNYLRSGFDLHLPKPVILEDLAALLDRPPRRAFGSDKARSSEVIASSQT